MDIKNNIMHTRNLESYICNKEHGDFKITMLFELVSNISFF